MELAASLVGRQTPFASARKDHSCPPGETAILGERLWQPGSLCSRALVVTHMEYQNFYCPTDAAALARALGQAGNRSWGDGRMRDLMEHMGSWLQQGLGKQPFFLQHSDFILHISGFDDNAYLASSTRHDRCL